MAKMMAITDHNWRSDPDGQLSTQASFSSSTLSVGTHTIYFKVKDDDDLWSTEVSETLVINPSTNIGKALYFRISLRL